MKTLVIVGGGASIKKYPTLFDDIVGHDVMSINYAYQFMKEIPKYQISLDRLFWTKNLKDMMYLKSKGCQLINSNAEYKGVKNHEATDDNTFFCGKQRLSGVFALDYACQCLPYDKIYLLGYDFGFTDGKSHFHDIEHSGMGKASTYYDREMKILEAVNDFVYFLTYDNDVFVVGDSNINALNKIKYEGFKHDINTCG
jgi:hypothetical protein